MAQQVNQMNTRHLNMKQYKAILTKQMNTRLTAIACNDYDLNLPLFVWGLPGIGKSQIASWVCKETWINAKNEEDESLYDLEYLLKTRPWDASSWIKFTSTDVKNFEKNLKGWILMDVRLSQIDPVEIKGAPFYDVAARVASFIRFNSVLPNSDSKWPVFLFLDELTLAPEMVQSAGYQLINERKVGDYRLPENCVTIAASNPPGPDGNFFEMNIALENRFDHITLDIDYDGFVKYVAKPDLGYDDIMIAFLQYSKEQDKETLYHIEGQRGKGNFPTFRSWEKALRKVKYGYKEYDAIADSVGLGCASKFDIFKELTKDIPPAKTLVDKKMYYEDISMQLVASQKVGNQLLNTENLKKLTADRSFEIFKYFMDMKNPKDVTDNREELTILFLVNLQEEWESLDKIDLGYKAALKKGLAEIEKNKDGENIVDIFGLILKKWAMMNEID